MKIKSIQAENLFSFDRIDLTLDPERNEAILITGTNMDDAGADSNGSGKTNLLNIIGWAIFGEVPDKVTVDKIIKKGTSKNYGMAKIELVSPNTVIQIERKRYKKESRRSQELKLIVNGENKTLNTTSQTQKEILYYLGFNTAYSPSAIYEDYLNSCYFTSSNIKPFAGKHVTNSERIEIISRLMSLNILDKCYDEVRDRAKDKEIELGKVESQIETYNNMMPKDIDKHTAISIIKSNNEKIKHLKESLESLQSISKDIIAQKNNIEVIKTKIESYRNQIQTIENQTRLNNINQNNMIKSLESRKISLKSTINESNKEMEILSNRRDQLKLSSKILSQEDESYILNQISNLESKKDSLSCTLYSLRSRISIAQKSKDGSIQCPKCNTKLIITEETVEILDDNIDSIINELIVNSTSVQSKITDISRTIEEQKRKISESNEIKREMQDIENDMSIRVSTIEHANTEIIRIDENIESIKHNIEEHNHKSSQQIAELNSKLSGLNIELQKIYEKYPDIDEQATRIQSEVADMEKQINNINMQNSTLEEKIKLIESIESNIKSLTSKQSQLSSDLKRLLFWKTGFPAIKMRLINKIVPILEMYTNRYLRQLSYNMSITFNITENKELEIKVIDSYGNVRDVNDLFSQGEAKRISLCTGLALRDISASYRNVPLNFIKFDEILDALDDRGSSEFIKLINTIDVQKFIISHNNELKDIFQNNIHIIKENGNSYISQ